MANKVSRVNVAITGDASGLKKAAKDASGAMAALKADADRTKRAFSAMKTETSGAASNLAKLGVESRGLSVLAGASGIFSRGFRGLELAGAGAALAGLTAVGAAYQNMAEEAIAARNAIQQVNRVGGGDFRKFGFTEQGARALAAMPREGAPIGFGRAFSQTTALSGAGRSNFQNIVEYLPGAIGTFLAGFAANRIPEAQDYAASIGATEARRLDTSLRDVLPFTMSVADMLMNFGRAISVEGSR